ncbi:SGNH/GDSL hydrolase family protein [Mangrovibacillus sp. Mu-81]|uniref:SGNH/GDSL hydrolase family protein n=1 Tax=Mangrovibacillus sp. Mu-81 TaxID=3121478 RepID=UPI002FE48D81
MKNFLLVLLTIVSVIFLILGNIYWNEKANLTLNTSPDNSEEATNSDSKEEVTQHSDNHDYSSAISNWPEEAQDRFMKAVNNQTPYKIAVVGSQALGSDVFGWSVQVKQSIEENFNSDVVVQIIEYEGTSTDFLDSIEKEEVVDMQPDLVLFEPFSLNDNSNIISPEQNHLNIDDFYDQLKKANQDVELLLQPTHPLDDATIYPRQVEELRSYAEEKGFTYLNHWTAWPEDETLREYLSETQDTPNELGHQIWAEYITDYFISD